jgi:hypothetical protein
LDCDIRILRDSMLNNIGHDYTRGSKLEIELSNVIAYWESFRNEPGYNAVDVSGKTIIPATVRFLKELKEIKGDKNSLLTIL